MLLNCKQFDKNFNECGTAAGHPDGCNAIPRARFYPASSVKNNTSKEQYVEGRIGIVMLCLRPRIIKLVFYLVLPEWLIMHYIVSVSSLLTFKVV